MGDRTLGAVVLLAAGAMAWAARDYAAIIAYEPVGPKAFPLLLAALLAVCGAWLALRPAAAGTAAPGSPLVRVGLCAGSVLVYAALFQFLGFVVATALMALAIGRTFGGNWRDCSVYGLLLGAGLFFMFDRLLDVVLPLGVLQPLLSLSS